MRSLCILTMALTISIPTAAAHDYATVVVPIVAYDVPGAHSSLWSSHLWVYNGTDRIITFEDDIRGVVMDCVSIPCLQPPPLGPGEAREIQVDNTFFGWRSEARILSVRDDIADRVHLSLRIRDESRASTSFGTEVPVVYESEMRSRPSAFMPVPFAAEFRLSLRISTPQEKLCETFDVSLINRHTGALLHTFSMTTTDPEGGCNSGFAPGYATVHSLEQRFPSLNLPNREIVIEVEPREETRYFAFLSVTSDSTQHVTVLAPNSAD